MDASCTATRPLLAEYVRGALGSGARRRIAQHLEHCTSCDEVRQQLGHLNRHLRAVPFWPAIFGTSTPSAVGLKAQLLSWFTSAAAPLATSGALAVTVLAPAMVYDDLAPERPARPAVVEVVGAGAVGTTPDEVVTAAAPRVFTEPDAPARHSPSDAHVEPVSAQPDGAASASSTRPPRSIEATQASSEASIVLGTPADDSRAGISSADPSVPFRGDPPAETASSGARAPASETIGNGESAAGQQGHGGESTGGGSAPGQQGDQGSGHGASPPGQQGSNNDHSLGGPPGQQDTHGSDHGASPPGQQPSDDGHPLGGPPGQQDSHGSDHGASPPGLQNNPGPSQAGASPTPGKSESGAAGQSPGQTDNPGNGHAGSPPGHQDELGDGVSEPGVADGGE